MPDTPDRVIFEAPTPEMTHADYVRDLECALELLYGFCGSQDLAALDRDVVDRALEQLWKRRRLHACDGNAEHAAAVERMLASSGAQ